MGNREKQRNCSKHERVCGQCGEDTFPVKDSVTALKAKRGSNNARRRKWGAAVSSGPGSWLHVDTAATGDGVLSDRPGFCGQWPSVSANQPSDAVVLLLV